MSFKNVEAEIAGNSYFDGAVTSRTLHFEDGSKKTLGFMQIGEYEFDTEAAELMEITSGDVEVLLPDASEWVRLKSGSSFNVPENSSFKIKVHEVTDYCCSYL